MRRHRVLIDLVPIRPGVGGSGSGIWTHAHHLVRELDRLAPDDMELHVLIDRTQAELFKDLRNIRVHRFRGPGGSALLRLCWIHVALPLVCLFLQADALHKLATETPVLLPVRRVTTVHDFYNEFMVEQQGMRAGAAGRYFAFITKVCFAKSRAVITVSEATRQEALARFPHTPATITAIHNGVDMQAAPGAAGGDAGPFTVLYVAKVMPYKGQLQAMEAFDHLLGAHPELKGRVRLVMHGFVNDVAYGAMLKARMERGALKGAVEMRPYGIGSSVQDIYRGAGIFLFLTSYEGFGLPVVEAQAMDIPVVCSDIPVLREVGGEGALYVERGDPAAVSAALYRLITDPGARAALVRQGAANRLRFGWDRMARGTLAVYRQVCA